MLWRQASTTAARCCRLLVRPRAQPTALPLFRYFSSWTVDPVSGLVYNGSSDTTSTKAVFQTIIGLEIHAQLEIPTKLFSNSPSSSSASATTSATNAPPNTQLSLMDVAVPGSLPVLSAAAVQAAVLAAAALDCSIQTTSRFERKHYIYADLATGYQITQQRWPIAINGCITLLPTTTTTNSTSNGKGKQKKQKDATHAKQQPTAITCRIERLQLEQDTGKTIIQQTDTNTTTTLSLVDFNRAGTALIEIVTAPDLRSASAAVQAVQVVRQLLRHCKVCDGQLQSGSLRVDLNVNLELIVDTDNAANGQQQQQQQPRRRSPRIEVKNLNSLRQVQDAAIYEAVRQAGEWSTNNSDNHNSVNNNDSLHGEQTRTWDVLQNKTVLLRLKDSAQDYRFLPDPDLPPVVLNAATLDGFATVQEFCQDRLPELPAQAVERLQETYGLSEYQAVVVTADPPAIALLDTAVATAVEQQQQQHNNDDDRQLSVHKIAERAANLLTNELFALVKENANDAISSDQEPSVQTSTVSGCQLGEIVVLLSQGTLSSTMAKKLLAVLFYENVAGMSVAQVAQDRGFELVTDPKELKDLCRKVLAEHSKEVAMYKQGGKMVNKMQKLLTGKTMAASRGNAHPERLREALTAVLEELAEE